MSSSKQFSNEIIFLGKQSYRSLGCYDYEYLLNLKRSFKNYKITFFHSYLYDQPKIKGVKYINIFKHNKKKFFIKVFLYIYSLVCIAFYILRKKPLSLHCQWFLLPFVDLIWIKTIRFFGWRGNLIQTIHNAKSRYSMYHKFFIKLCIKELDTIIVHSSKCKNYLLKKYIFKKGVKIFVGRHGVIKNIVEEKFLTSEIDIYKKILSHRDKYKNLFIHIGSVTQYKGFDILYSEWQNYKKNSKNKFNSGLLILGKFDKLSKQKIKNLLNDESIIIFDQFVSDKLLDLSVTASDYIVIPHNYISHSGIYSSFLKKYKPFIFYKNEYNHMISHAVFNKTGIYFDQKNIFLKDILNNIESNKVQKKFNRKIWVEAVDYFSWTNCFSKKLLLNIYRIDK